MLSLLCNAHAKIEELPDVNRSLSVSPELNSYHGAGALHRQPGQLLLQGHPRNIETVLTSPNFSLVGLGIISER